MKRISHVLLVSLLLVSFFILHGLPQMAQATSPSLALQASGPHTNFPLYAANIYNNNVVRLESNGSQTLFTSGGNILSSIGLAIDSSGNLYTADIYKKIIKISPDGAQSVFIANTGNIPYGLVCDDNDNLYYAITKQIIKVTPTGVQSTFASNGYLGIPVGLAFDSNGNLYAANYQGATNSVIKITPGGVQSVFTEGGNISNPRVLAFDANDNLYVSEVNGSNVGSIIKVTPAGVQSVYTTGGLLDNLISLAIDRNGNLYAGNQYDEAIVKIDTAGSQSVFASGGNLASPTGLAFREATQVTTTTVELAPNPAVFGQSVSITATVAMTTGTPTGMVDFFADSAILSGCDQVYLDGNGVATCTTAALAAGTHPIYASYNGYGDYIASTSTSTDLVVAKAPTKTTLSAASPSIYGNAVTFTASVTSTTGVTPTGTITLTIDTTNIVRTLDANGAATYVTNTLAVDTHTITATYSGGANFLSNPPKAITVSVINPAPALTQLQPASAAVGASGFTLGIHGSGFFEASQVYWNGAAITTTLVSSTALQAEISVSQLTAAGVYNITVQNPLPGGGTSNTLLFSVNNPAPALTQLQPVSVTAGASGFTLGIRGSGFVATSQAYWNGVAITTTLVSSTALQAEISTSRLTAAGVYSITVQNPLPGGGTSNTLLFTVNKATSSVALESCTNPARFGETVTITATVSGANGTPSGTVTISTTVGGAVLQMRAIRSQTLVDGKASFTLPALAPGSYDIQVIYSGDDRFATASGSLTQVVSAPKVYIPLLLQNAE